MKSEILRLLKESDDYISGQQMCDRFHVSRTAVWKAIEQLKKEEINPLIGQLLWHRNIRTEEALRKFLHPTIEDIYGYRMGRKEYRLF